MAIAFQAMDYKYLEIVIQVQEIDRANMHLYDKTQ